MPHNHFSDLPKICRWGLQTLSSKSGKKKKLLNMMRISNSKHFLSAREVRDDTGLNEKISIHTEKRYLQRLKLFERISRRMHYQSAKYNKKRRLF